MRKSFLISGIITSTIGLICIMIIISLFSVGVFKFYDVVITEDDFVKINDHEYECIKNIDELEYTLDITISSKDNSDIDIRFIIYDIEEEVIMDINKTTPFHVDLRVNESSKLGISNGEYKFYIYIYEDNKNIDDLNIEMEQVSGLLPVIFGVCCSPFIITIGLILITVYVVKERRKKLMKNEIINYQNKIMEMERLGMDVRKEKVQMK